MEDPDMVDISCCPSHLIRICPAAERISRDSMPAIVHIKKIETAIGRERNAVDVHLDSVRVPRMISRVHAHIVYSHHQWKVRDNRSVNGVFVNDRKVHESTLNDGDVVVFGGGGNRPIGSPLPSKDASEFCYVFRITHNPILSDIMMDDESSEEETIVTQSPVDQQSNFKKRKRNQFEDDQSIDILQTKENNNTSDDILLENIENVENVENNQKIENVENMKNDQNNIINQNNTINQNNIIDQNNTIDQNIDSQNLLPLKKRIFTGIQNDDDSTTHLLSLPEYDHNGDSKPIGESGLLLQTSSYDDNSVLTAANTLETVNTVLDDHSDACSKSSLIYTYSDDGFAALRASGLVLPIYSEPNSFDASTQENIRFWQTELKKACEARNNYQMPTNNQSPDESFICPICRDIMSYLTSGSPSSLPCGHTFCADCIESSILLDPQCPICHSSIIQPITLNPDLKEKLLDYIKDLTHEEREDWFSRFSERNDAVRLAKLELVLACSQAKGFKFLRLGERWTEADRTRFWSGIHEYYGKSRVVYCRTIGLTDEFINSATKIELIDALGSLGIQIIICLKRVRLADMREPKVVEEAFRNTLRCVIDPSVQTVSVL